MPVLKTQTRSTASFKMHMACVSVIGEAVDSLSVGNDTRFGSKEGCSKSLRAFFTSLVLPP